MTTPSYGYDGIHASFQVTDSPLLGYDASANWFTAVTFEASSGTAVNFQKFTGKERDSESGLDYFGARYYGAALGRFPSPDDPLVDQQADDPQSWNLYGYVRNNPLANTDPDGYGAKPTPCQTATYTHTTNAVDAKTTTEDWGGSGNCPPPLGDFDYDIFQRVQNVAAQFTDATLNYLNQPRDPLCMAKYAAKGGVIGGAAGGITGGLGGGLAGSAAGPGGTILFSVAGFHEGTMLGTGIGIGAGTAAGFIACTTGGGGDAGGGPDRDIEKKVKQFSRRSLSEQKALYKNLLRTYVEHLAKYGQTAGETMGETNRMERELFEMKKILEARGQSVD